MPKISIIVPVYNVEKYLEKCIESILNQTFNDYELILINDGSTDNSGRICDYYLKKDKRIKVIHKENSGQADSRNYGLKIAKGEYIGFVDSDDTIDSEMYEVLYNLCVKYDADISTCLLKMIQDGKVINKSYSCKIEQYNNKQAIACMYDKKLSGFSPCNKLYKSKLFDDIKFPMGRIYEDASILYKLYMKSNKVIFIEKPFYNYIRRVGSTTNQKFSNKRFDIVYMYNEKYEFMLQNYPEMCENIKNMYYISLRNIIVDIVKEKTIIKNYKYLKKASNLIKKEVKYILKNKLVTFNHKLLAILIAYIPVIPISLYSIKLKFCK